MKNSANPLQRLANVLNSVVDEKVGIIRYVQERRREAGSPNFFHFVAQACNTQAFTQQKNFSYGGGASVNKGAALAKAVGEAVERYCSAIYDINELPLTSYSSAPFPCISPNEFALYSHEQLNEPNFFFAPFEETTPVRWTPALDLVTEETCYVPAAKVFIPYEFDTENGDTPITQPISTGLAAHLSLAEATISAICEVIERDAFTITWQAQLSRSRIRLETLSPVNIEIIERFQRAGNIITLLNLTLDAGVPTILAIRRNSSRNMPALGFAAATALNPEVAVCKALEELAHTGCYMQYIMSNRPRLVPTHNHKNIITDENHLNFWCDHANASKAEFLFSIKKSISFEEIQNLSSDDPQEDLKILTEKVQAINHRVLISNLTTPDVDELGFNVVRAMIPGFHPLCMGYNLRALGGFRLWTIPQKLGYQGITRESGDNPHPHPYP